MSVLMQGNDGTFNFLETVLKEVLELFPSKHVHIGGDEVRPSAAAALRIYVIPAVMGAFGVRQGRSSQRVLSMLGKKSAHESDWREREHA